MLIIPRVWILADTGLGNARLQAIFAAVAVVMAEEAAAPLATLAGVIWVAGVSAICMAIAHVNDWGNGANGACQIVSNARRQPAALWRTPRLKKHC